MWGDVDKGTERGGGGEWGETLSEIVKPNSILDWEGAR